MASHFLALGLTSKSSNTCFEPADVLFGLFEVMLDGFLQLGRGGGLRDFGQGLDELLLGAVSVGQFRQKQFG